MAQIILCKTPPCRLRWNSLFKAQVNEDSDDPTPYFTATVIFDKAAQAHPAYAEMKDAEKEGLKRFLAKHGDDAPHNPNLPIRDGSVKNLKKYPEFGDGATFINVKTKQRPGIVHAYLDPDTGKPKVIDDEDAIYNGIWVRLSLSVYDYKKKGNAGVSFGLRNVQKVKDGERLGPSNRAEDDFDAIDGASSPDDMFD